MMQFWLQLPEIFRLDVVKKLDYKSRCCLRKVSKSERTLVDSCPVFLDYVTVEPRVGNQIYFSIEESKSEALLNDKAYGTDDVLQDFRLIFKNPKSRIKQLTVDHYNFQRQPDAINELFASLITSNLKMKIEKLSFHYGEMSEVSFLNFMKSLDSKFLNTLRVRKFPVKSLPVLKELVATEHWRSLKDIRIQEKIPNSIEIFSHCDTFRVTFHSLSSLSAWKCVQNFRSTPRPPRSFFEIFLMQEFSIQDFLAHFDVAIENRPIQKYVSNLVLHTQHFKLNWSNDLLLIVWVSKRCVKGVICRKEFLLEDFEENDDF